MNRRAYQLALASFAIITVVSLMTAAYWYGRSGRALQSNASAADKHTRLLLGRVVRIEPLHVYVASASIGAERTYDVLISPQTKLLHLVDWAPGEREQAAKEHDAELQKMRPQAGTPVPPPPPEMKPVPLDPSALVVGMEVGVASNDPIDPEEPIIAAFIRPLTPAEARTGRVANTFPL